MKVILEKVFRKEVTTKKGLCKTISLKISQTEIELVNGNKVAVNDRWLGSKLYDINASTGMEDWKDGMEVDIKVIEKPDAKDPSKVWLTFEPRGYSLEDKLEALTARVDALEAR